MAADSSARAARITLLDQLRAGRDILLQEGNALLALAGRLDGEFCRAVDLVYGCRGSVIVSGMGKAGLIGQKIVATLASTGTPAHFLHPAEAVHGDLGRVHGEDVVLMLSQSGETEEVARLLPSLRALGVPILAITARADSALGHAATVVLEMGSLEEACPLGLAPSTSTTAMLALGDALALVVSRMRNFGRDDFARFHPAGMLGRRLSKVEDYMRPLDECRVAPADQTVRAVFVGVSRPGRRSGAIMLTDREGRLAGIFTDSDLARLFERRRDADLDQPIAQVMTAHPRTVPLGARMTEAVAILAQCKISELPVVDSVGRPLGMLDITDVFELLPKPSLAEGAAGAPSAPPAPHWLGRRFQVVSASEADDIEEPSVPEEPDGFEALGGS